MNAVTVQPIQHDLFVAIVSQLPQGFPEIVASKPKLRLAYMTTADIKHCEEADRITRLAHLFYSLYNYCYIYNATSNLKKIVKQEERPSRQTLLSVRMHDDCKRLNAAITDGARIVRVTPDAIPGSGKPRVGKGNDKLVWQTDGLADISTEIISVAEGQGGLIEKQDNEAVLLPEAINDLKYSVYLGTANERNDALDLMNESLLRGEDDLSNTQTRPLTRTIKGEVDPHYTQKELDRLNSEGCEHCKLSPAKCTCGNPVENDRKNDFQDDEYDGFSNDEERLETLLERREELEAQIVRARLAVLHAKNERRYLKQQHKTLVKLNIEWSALRLQCNTVNPGSNAELELLASLKKVENREYAIQRALDDLANTISNAVASAEGRRFRAEERLEETLAEIATLQNRLKMLSPILGDHTPAVPALGAASSSRTEEGPRKPTTEDVLRNWLTVLSYRLDACGPADLQRFRALELQYAALGQTINNMAASPLGQARARAAAGIIVARAQRNQEAFNEAVAAYKAATAPR